MDMFRGNYRTEELRPRLMLVQNRWSRMYITSQHSGTKYVTFFRVTRFITVSVSWALNDGSKTATNHINGIGCHD